MRAERMSLSRLVLGPELGNLTCRKETTTATVQDVEVDSGAVILGPYIKTPMERRMKVNS